jgi:hypothetical protein
VWRRRNTWISLGSDCTFVHLQRLLEPNHQNGSVLAKVHSLLRQTEPVPRWALVFWTPAG